MRDPFEGGSRREPVAKPGRAYRSMGGLEQVGLAGRLHWLSPYQMPASGHAGGQIHQSSCVVETSSEKPRRLERIQAQAGDSRWSRRSAITTGAAARRAAPRAFLAHALGDQGEPLVEAGASRRPALVSSSCCAGMRRSKVRRRA